MCLNLKLLIRSPIPIALRTTKVLSIDIDKLNDNFDSKTIKTRIIYLISFVKVKVNVNVLKIICNIKLVNLSINPFKTSIDCTRNLDKLNNRIKIQVQVLRLLH